MCLLDVAEVQKNMRLVAVKWRKRPWTVYVVFVGFDEPYVSKGCDIYQAEAKPRFQGHAMWFVEYSPGRFSTSYDVYLLCAYHLTQLITLIHGAIILE